MTCANSITGATFDLDWSQTYDFLEPQPERPDTSASPGDIHKCGGFDTPYPCLPARAGAVCKSAEDEEKIKTVLEQACRLLGSRCTFELKAMIENMAPAALLKAVK